MSAFTLAFVPRILADAGLASLGEAILILVGVGTAWLAGIASMILSHFRSCIWPASLSAIAVIGAIVMLCTTCETPVGLLYLCGVPLMFSVIAMARVHRRVRNKDKPKNPDG